MDTSWAVFLGGIGAGTVATSIVQHFLARSAKKTDLLITEKKEAFTGYLSALAKVNESDKSRENLANYGLWVARVQLVATPEVSRAIEEMRHTTPGMPERTNAVDKIIYEMRRDIGF